MHVEEKHGQMKRCAVPQCDYMAYQEICVKRHIASKHEQLRHLACPHCDYRFGLETILNEHLRDTNIFVKNVPCTGCDRKFYKVDGLHRHLATSKKCTHGPHLSQREKTIMNALQFYPTKAMVYWFW